VDAPGFWIAWALWSIGAGAAAYVRELPLPNLFGDKSNVRLAGG
jgi:hypothetical protein